jgi:hypothetical protein
MKENEDHQRGYIDELKAQLASLRAENERLTERAELAEWYITESKTKIFYELLEDIAELRAKAKKFWRGFYSLGQWDAGDDLTHWAEIPRPEGE